MVLLALAAVFVTLIPPYLENWRFGRTLRELAGSPETRGMRDEQVRAVVAQRAAAMGLPVENGQVQVVREGGRIRLGVKYSVRVQTPVYSVSLHFHPAAGP